jgi:hypothetical protein
MSWVSAEGRALHGMGPGADSLTDRFGPGHAVALSTFGQCRQQIFVHPHWNDRTLAGLSEPRPSSLAKALDIKAGGCLLLPSVDLILSDGNAADRLVHRNIVIQPGRGEPRTPSTHGRDDWRRLTYAKPGTAYVTKGRP